LTHFPLLEGSRGRVVGVAVNVVGAEVVEVAVVRITTLAAPDQIWFSSKVVVVRPSA